MTADEWIAFFRRPEIAAFNRTMAENADAALPRLVFADWVEENLHKPHFVAALRRSIDEPAEVVRCRGLLNFHGAVFRFRFGRLWAQIDTNHASTSRRAKQDLLKAICASGWVGHLVLRIGPPESLGRWLADPIFALLEGLDLSHQQLPPAVSRPLFADLNAPLLRRLLLWNCGLANTGALAVARCASLGELDELDIGSNGLTVAGIGAIVGAKALPNLTRLTLDGNLVGLDGTQHFLYAKPWTKLKYLSVQLANIGSGGATNLANAPCLSELQELRLTENDIGPAGIAELANSRHLPEVVRAWWRHQPGEPAA